ncbi:RraA family protein [Ancylobacter terrae]|uniref:RraA family protein n=1 Tax=Ancylobacter sp. sgz301288 TaxID=3342077 RepID=UPI00385AF3DF
MIGLRIRKRRQAVSWGLIEKYRCLPVANVSDNMCRLSAGGARLRPMHDGSPLAGPAVTVKAPPGDNLFLHKALDLAEPGDVIVVDAGGDLTNSLFGEMMAAHAIARKIGGLVINGAVRDAAALRESSLPVFAAGVTHRGPYKNGPGEINVPIAIDGMVVEPGDLILGDEDGVLCVPHDAAEEVYARSLAKQAAEAAHIEDIRRGRSDRSWIDVTLQKLGCLIEP